MCSLASWIFNRCWPTSFLLSFCRSVTDPRDGKRVALKKMPNVFQNLISCKRVYRELKMLATFKHDNVSISFIFLQSSFILSQWSMASSCCRRSSGRLASYILTEKKKRSNSRTIRKRSCGKLMFSQASVILSTGVGSCVARGMRGSIRFLF